MSESQVAVSAHDTSLGFADRIFALAAWAVGGTIFLTVGWHAMAPHDPLGAVSVLSRPNGWAMILQSAGLAGVCAALATILAGRKLADVGVFAVSLGLALVSIRGATSSSMLQQGIGAVEFSERSLAFGFAIEALGWFGVIMVAVMISAAIMQWIHLGRRGSRKETNRASHAGDPPGIPSGFDVPRLSPMIFATSGPCCTPLRDGVKHAGLCAAVAMVAATALSVGLTSRSIQHGQVCFVIFAAVFVATYITQRIIPIRSAFWSIVAVGLMTVVSYLWASVRPLDPSLPPYVPSSHFLRLLPIQFVAVGVAAALAATWYTVVPETAEERHSGRGNARPAKSG